MGNMGARIKRIRESKGLSQADVADRMNVSDRTISAWENGTRNPKDIIGLSMALQVDIKELVQDNDSESFSPNINSVFSITSKGKGVIRSLRFYSNEGFITLVVDGKRGEFMNQYSELDRNDKLYVIENMLEELNVVDESLGIYRIQRIDN